MNTSRRVHVKVLQADSEAALTRKVNNYLDALYDLDPGMDVVSIGMDNTPGNWFDAYIVFKSVAYDPAALYELTTLKDM